MPSETKKVRSRAAVVKLIKSWLGKNESNGTYKSIVDIYNSYEGKLPREIKMEYGWAWCACTWSALAIKLGYTDIMPIEISCGYLIEAAKKMKIWVENDAYIPAPGDAILYDWDDDGVGDDTGWPEHVGTVVSVDEKRKEITVIEGNFDHAVKTRVIPINGRYIRGFITPKYTENTVVKEDDQKVEEKKPETPKKAEKKVKAVGYATKKDDAITGIYVATTDVYCRDDASIAKRALTTIPKGHAVNNYGYYSVDAQNKKWLYITTVINNVEYIGFCCGDYLQKK